MSELRRSRRSQEDRASSGEPGAHRKCWCASELNSGERMLAGGGCVAGGCSPAKPRWSEMIVFWMFSSGRAPPYRRKSLAGEGGCVSYLSSGERMFAGGHRFPSGRNPAKPPWSEVTIFLDFLLRQSSPYRRTASAPVRWVLVGVGVAPGSSTPGSECWPEEDVWWEAELRRSRGGRR